MAKPNWVGKWPGGRIKLGNGQVTFVIRKRALGKRWKITLDSTALEDESAEFALFKRDPINYKTRSQYLASHPKNPMPLKTNKAVG